MTFLFVCVLLGILIAFHFLIGVLFVLCFCFYLWFFHQRHWIGVCIILVGMMSVYTLSVIRSYDFKYQEDFFEEKFSIVSYEGESKFYYKYLAKNKDRDYFLLYLKKDGKMQVDASFEIKVWGKFCLPDLDRNEGDFNLRRYYNSHRIFGTIMVEKMEVIEENEPHLIEKIRRKMERAFYSLLPPKHAGLISAMLNGNKNLVDEEVKDDFKNSGVSHLLAVSGMHVSSIVLFIGVASNHLFGKRMSYFVSILGIILYIFVAGASASVIRAGVMAILNLLSIILSRKPFSLNHLCFSGIFLLILNPLTIYDVGFILSFVGTLGIVLFSKKLGVILKDYLKISWIRETLVMTISVQVLILPIMMYYFHSISWISFLSNLLIVPVSSFLIIIGIIIVLTSFVSLRLASVFSYALYLVLSYVFLVTHILAKTPFGNMLVIRPAIWMIIAYYSLIFLLQLKSFPSLYHYKKYGYYIWIAFLMIHLVLTVIPRKAISINMVDVGQGDCFYIESIHKRTVLIDGGGSEGSDYDVGENIVIPYLLNHGKKSIDLIIISHPHEDHIEGIFPVLEQLKVKQVVIGKNLEENELIKKLTEICQQKNIKLSTVGQGDFFSMDGILFQVLFPDEKYHSTNLNNQSLLIKMTYEGISALFTGDLEDEIEDMGHFAQDVDILKVGHHGSDTSTSLKLLKKATPQIALISVGKDNHYGHPKEIVLNRLRKYQAKVFRTDECGEVCLMISKNQIKIKTRFIK